MKKFLLLISTFFILPAFCEENINFVGIDEAIQQEQSIQSKIDNIGFKLLNTNQIPKRIVFVYNHDAQKSKMKMDTTLTSRQVVIYDTAYKFAENDDELAAYMAREISLALKSFEGYFAGGLKTLQVKAAPKKYEMVADKRAVDYLVKAGYNPLGMITYIQKTSPQRRFDRFSNKNLTSKRLAVIYEYIYTKYPYFLANNEYINNPYYQNFLLTSLNNRRMLQSKIETGSKAELDYE